MVKKLFRAPFVLFVICIITYGSLATMLGFYWDDWLVILLTKAKLSFWEFFQFNRPFSFWVYEVLTLILGVSPIRWHIFGVLLWWLVVLSMWWVLQEFWPQQKLETFAIAALFSVYPAFY